MPSDRFFLSSPLTAKLLEIEGDELHHLSKVMRKRVGDVVEVVNGCGEKIQGTITTLDSKKAAIQVDLYDKVQPPKPSFILAQALCRFPLLEWIIEKGCELDAAEFWLFAGERGETTEIFPRQRQRLQALLIAALKQSGRLYLPKIVFKEPLSRWKKGKEQILFGDLSEIAPRMPKPSEERVVFCVGPEKGFSPQEIAHLKGPLEARGVKLHHNILRTETAGLVALSQLF